MRNSCILYLLRIIRKKKKSFAVVNFAPHLFCVQQKSLLPAVHQDYRGIRLGTVTLDTKSVAGSTISLCIHLFVSTLIE